MDTEERLIKAIGVASLLMLVLALTALVAAAFAEGDTAIKWALVAIACGVISKVVSE